MKKENLYIFSIMDSNMKIEIENNKFIDLLEYTFINYPNLYTLEKNRLAALMNSSSNSFRYKQKLDEFLKEMQIPLYLIAVGNDCEAREIITQKRIVPNYPAALGVKRQFTKEQFDVVYGDSYSTKVLNFLSFEIEQKEKIKVKY